MTNKINTIRELRDEKDKLRKLGGEQMKEMKSSLRLVKDESKNILVYKILIPVGAAILIGYGVKKLIEAFKSDDEELPGQSTISGQQGDPPVYHRSEVSRMKQKNGFLSNVDWSAAAVKILPFVIAVGKKMYEDGNLPFFEPPSRSE